LCLHRQYGNQNKKKIIFIAKSCFHNNNKDIISLKYHCFHIKSPSTNRYLLFSVNYSTWWKSIKSTFHKPIRQTFVSNIQSTFNFLLRVFLTKRDWKERLLIYILLSTQYYTCILFCHFHNVCSLNSDKKFIWHSP